MGCFRSSTVAMICLVCQQGCDFVFCRQILRACEFGVLGTHQRVYTCQWCRLLVVGRGLLGSHVQRRNNEKKLDILMVKIKLVSRNSMALISRRQSKDNIAPIFLLSLFLFFPLLGGWKTEKRGRERWKEKIPQSSGAPCYLRSQSTVSIQLP